MLIRLTIALISGIAISACAGPSAPSVPAQPQQSQLQTRQAAAGGGVTITVLPALPGTTGFQAFGINNDGVVVGRSSTGGTTPYAVAVKYQNGKVTNLGGRPDFSNSEAGAVNQSGVAAGISCVAKNGEIDGQCDAALWNSTGYHDLGHPSDETNSYANGINDAGDVVGFTGNIAIEFHAGKIYSLGPGQANAINDHGIAVGVVYAFSKAYIYQIGHAPVQITMPSGGSQGQPDSINNCNTISGVFSTGAIYEGGSESHPFVYARGKARDIGLPAGGHYSGYAFINNEGWVAGAYSKDGQTNYAFLYRSGRMIDLNTLLPAGSPWVLNSVRALNDRGDLVGDGTYEGVNRSYLLHIPS